MLNDSDVALTDTRTSNLAIASCAVNCKAYAVANCSDASSALAAAVTAIASAASIKSCASALSASKAK